MISAGIDIVRLPWRFEAGCGGVWSGCDADEILRLSEDDVGAAAVALAKDFQIEKLRSPIKSRLADKLFADYTLSPNLSVCAWAETHGCSREGVSREFRRLYGVSPTVLRVELRARSAWRCCIETSTPLAEIALEAGYADQAHMARDVIWVTGRSPGSWRKCRQHMGW